MEFKNELLLSTEGTNYMHHLLNKSQFDARDFVRRMASRVWCVFAGLEQLLRTWCRKLDIEWRALQLWRSEIEHFL